MVVTERCGGAHGVFAYDGIPLLAQCWRRLLEMGIQCPAPRLDVKVGYTNKRGVVSRQDTWQLGAYRAVTLGVLLRRLLPHMKHAKRVSDAKRAFAAAEALQLWTAKPTQIREDRPGASSALLP